MAALVAVPWAYVHYGKGVEFFPNVEPEYGLLYVHARGNLSLPEQDALVRQAEERILGWPGIETVYTRVGRTQGGGAQNDPSVKAVNLGVRISEAALEGWDSAQMGKLVQQLATFIGVTPEEAMQQVLASADEAVAYLESHSTRS